jgi:dihydrofolate synthase/folylpolyglutamate synthase
LPPPRFAELSAWLAWQETLHPKRIDPGLDRVRQVWSALAPKPLGCPVITVAGTNGKGSSVAMLETILVRAGYRVGAYSSPHVRRYNERVRLVGREIDDAQMCAAFARIDAARGAVSLSYFEFGTLAALDTFREAGVDVAVLEVGMGGRLDAVNLIDADIALVSSIDIDHSAWLGNDRESIGREKAGIFRPGKPVVCGDPAPPQSLVEHAAALDAPLYRFGREYRFDVHGERWTWEGPGGHTMELPRPALPGRIQLRNAANAVMALELLRPRLQVTAAHIAEGLQHTRLAGRFQTLPGPVMRVLDVAHNPEAAAVLAQNLRDQSCAGRTHMVVGMLGDKDIAATLQALAELGATWHLAPVRSERSASAADLAAALGSLGQGVPVTTYPSVAAACAGADQTARHGDRIAVLGSFYTVAEALDVYL